MLLEVENIEKSFSRNKVLSGVSLKVDGGEIVGVIGPNGGGKTTLFNCISGYYPCDCGKVLLDGVSIEKMKAHRICRLGMARTFQVAKPFPDLTVGENIAVGSLVYVEREKLKWGIMGKKRLAMELSREIAEEMGLYEVFSSPVSQLDTGASRKLELARAIATRPRVLLLDEIMAGLSSFEAEDVGKIINKIKQRGTGVLMIEHRMDLLMSLCDRIYALDGGEVIGEGTPQYVTALPRVIKSYLGMEYGGDTLD